MLTEVIISTVILVADFSLVVNSQTTSIREIHFRFCGNIDFVGGSQTIVPAGNKFNCILQCASNASCQGFAYKSDVCVKVDWSRVTRLDFVFDPVIYRVRRNILLLNLDFDPNTLFIKRAVTLEKKLILGDMVYLKAILLKHGDVVIEIYESPDRTNVTFQFRARCYNLVACNNDFYVTITNKFNNSWNTSNYVGNSYTLAENETFDVHVLITANGIVTYLNGVSQFTLATEMSALTANYVYFYGNMKVLEFSV